MKMQAIRTQDKLFLSVVVPLLAVAVYIYGWRGDASRQNDGLRQECATLVATEDYAAEKAMAERRLKSAADALDAERRMAPPRSKVRGVATESVAMRERAVQGVLRDAGLVTLRSAPIEVRDTTARDALRATGVRPNAVCRAYIVTGGYENLRAALHAFATREMAVIPVHVTWTVGQTMRIVLWL